MSQPRRTFLKTSGLTAAAASVAPTILAKENLEANSKTINVGIVGLGGRGRGAILNALRSDPNVRLVAIAEVFRDRLDNNLAELQKSMSKHSPELMNKIAVPEENKFSDFDGYKRLLETDVDMVILTTPPHFRPLHAKACIDAGKHVFAEKPLATDPVGLRSIMETVKKAKEKNLTFVVGFMNRFNAAIKATIGKIHEGAIGEVTNVQANYNVGYLWHRGDNAEWSGMERQMRNWYYYNWLCGGQLIEQCVHNTDKLVWLMGDKAPISCLGFGGRQVRTEEKWGNIYDHYSVSYEFENNAYGNVNCRQMRDATNGVSDFIRGSEGYCNLNRLELRGKTNWRFDKKRNPIKNPYDQEHVELMQGIRSGQSLNNGEVSCISTGLSIMGTLSAHTGQRVYWDHENPKVPSLMKSQLDWTPAYEWNELPVAPVAKPGITKFI